jgi:ribosomal protein S27E
MAKTNLRYEERPEGDYYWIACPDCGYENQALVLINNAPHVSGGEQCVHCRPTPLEPRRGALGVRDEVRRLIANAAAAAEPPAEE